MDSRTQDRPLRTAWVSGLIALLALPVAVLASEACPDRARIAEATGLRLAADDSAPTVAFVRADALVEALVCEGSWARVDASASGRGWMPRALLAPAPAQASVATVTVAAAPPIAALSPRPQDVPRIDEPAAGSSVEPRRPLLLREEPSWGSAVAGRSPAGEAVEVLSRSELGWSLVDAGLDRPVWVVTAALRALPLRTVR